MDADEEEDTAVTDLKAHEVRTGIVEQLDARMAELRAKYGGQ